MKKQRIRISLH